MILFPSPKDTIPVVEYIFNGNVAPPSKDTFFENYDSTIENLD